MCSMHLDLPLNPGVTRRGEMTEIWGGRERDKRRGRCCVPGGYLGGGEGEEGAAAVAAGGKGEERLGLG
jgi:hypothetical protein